jgi:hypothetical protein
MEKNGLLQADSPWRTDTLARSASISYNKSFGFAVAAGEIFNAYATEADAIINLDLDACGKKDQSLQTVPAAPGYQ